jgi:hypothetical protein
MTIIFEPDIQLQIGCRTASPHIAAFVSELIPELAVLYQTGPNSLEGSSNYIHLRGMLFVEQLFFF